MQTIRCWDVEMFCISWKGEKFVQLYSITISIFSQASSISVISLDSVDQPLMYSLSINIISTLHIPYVELGSVHDGLQEYHVIENYIPQDPIKRRKLLGTVLLCYSVQLFKFCMTGCSTVWGRQRKKTVRQKKQNIDGITEKQLKCYGFGFIGTGVMGRSHGVLTALRGRSDDL